MPLTNEDTICKWDFFSFANLDLWWFIWNENAYQKRRNHIDSKNNGDVTAKFTPEDSCFAFFFFCQFWRSLRVWMPHCVNGGWEYMNSKFQAQNIYSTLLKVGGKERQRQTLESVLFCILKEPQFQSVLCCVCNGFHMLIPFIDKSYLF